MMGFTTQRHVSAPIELVFEHAADLRSAPKRMRGITKLEVLTDGPIRVGTRFRETRIMFKREASEEMEITAFDPPHGYTVGCENHGCRYHTTFTFTPNGSGTNVAMRFEGEPLTFFTKVMAVLTRPLMKSCLKAMEQDLDDLKASAERAHAAQAAPAP